jgi:hypothetical protein
MSKPPNAPAQRAKLAKTFWSHEDIVAKRGPSQRIGKSRAPHLHPRRQDPVGIVARRLSAIPRPVVRPILALAVLATIRKASNRGAAGLEPVA